MMLNEKSKNNRYFKIYKFTEEIIKYKKKLTFSFLVININNICSFSQILHDCFFLKNMIQWV